MFDSHSESVVPECSKTIGRRGVSLRQCVLKNGSWRKSVRWRGTCCLGYIIFCSQLLLARVSCQRLWKRVRECHEQKLLERGCFGNGLLSSLEGDLLCSPSLLTKIMVFDWAVHPGWLSLSRTMCPLPRKTHQILFWGALCHFRIVSAGKKKLTACDHG